MEQQETSRALPFRFVYHEGYDLNFGSHVFPSRKFRLIRDRILCTGFAKPADFVKPQKAPKSDLLLVHEPDWVNKLTHGTLSFQEIRQLEVPYSRQMVNGYFLSAGGTTLAAECALEEGVGFNIGGGFHHAFAGHGEGFCAVNDIAVAIRSLQERRIIKKALVVDCDVHHGNGTAAIFATAADVFTLSIHQYHNYPATKPPSTYDIHLPDGVGDEEYMKRLAEPLEMAITGFHPDLLIFVAGADPYRHDQLGGLDLSMEGLKERDRLVFETALKHNVPVAVTLAGGYAENSSDTVTIHINTAIAAKECLAKSGWTAKIRTSAP